MKGHRAWPGADASARLAILGDLDQPAGLLLRLVMIEGTAPLADPQETTPTWPGTAEYWLCSMRIFGPDGWSVSGLETKCCVFDDEPANPSNTGLPAGAAAP